MLEIKNLSIEFACYKSTVKAVRDVSFSLKEGEVLGLAGESGCGKTTTALSIPRLLPNNAVVTGGQVLFRGEDLLTKTEEEIEKIRWSQISFVFQGAMNALNPVMTVESQIIEAILFHTPTTSKTEAHRRVLELLDKVGISSKYAGNYPHEFSGGMRQRAMIAMALACNPSLVIADEPITALDVMVQAQILKLIKNLCNELNLAMILISHDLSVIAETCDRVAIMYAGKLAEEGTVKSVFSHPSHPYTQALLQAFPNIHKEKQMIAGIPGNPPNLVNLPSGCAFHERCTHRLPKCAISEPPMITTPVGQHAACFLLEDDK
jgi:peptide/nickel transport system ATP-binding protein